ncbi:cadherin-9-like [Micropterus dolomieu]|uniref:cadherin-9-like n=1 Tax=Micropterus dolomieu TaxID=147949 RepID=UPI001E8D1530|nr:cadherin-9-like [Micropterus dolomieu]
MKYSIDRRTDMDRLFNVHPGNGSVFLLKSLDREESAWHNISIIATEFNNPRQSSHVPVYIHLLDINDNAPTFATVYETFVCEKTKAGQVLQLYHFTLWIYRQEVRWGSIVFYLMNPVSNPHMVCMYRIPYKIHLS